MSEQLCGCIEAACWCVLREGHDGPHECDCGGSWDVQDGVVVIVAFPIAEGVYPRGRTAALGHG